MKIKSDTAILDVTSGRNRLLKSVDAHGPIKVVIHGWISGAWGNDDGVSREFQVDVTEVELG